MPAGCKSLYGYDRWPESMPDPFIGLVIGKKWRRMRDVGFPIVDATGKVVGREKVEFKDPWVPMLESAKALLSEEYFRVSEWTEQHFHDFVMYDKLITWGCASSSKSLCLSEPVFYPDHVGTVAEVKPGDYILAATGAPVRVRAVFPHYDRPLYRVRFAGGEEVICCDEHLWTVRYWGRTRWVGPRKTRKAEQGWVTRTRSAAYLAKLGTKSIRRRRMSIPLTAPLEFDERPVPIDPYVLGCLLGDGSITQTIILTSRAEDSEVRDEFSKGLPKGYVLKRVGSSKTAYIVVKEDGSKTNNAIISALKSLGLYGHRSHDKFIPGIYKLNSVEVRTALLAGLLDTDGSVSAIGEISFTSVSERLAEDVRFLADTLGARTTMQVNESSYCKDGRRIMCKPAYTVRIQGLPLERTRELFRLTRKRDRLRRPARGVGFRKLESVTLIPDRENYDSETRCIALDEKDAHGNPVNGLFPVGRCIITHNSNDTALLLLLDWMVDPFDTVTLLGSTSKVDLRSRSWEAIVRYHNALKICNRDKYLIPGKISKQGQSLINIEDDDSAASAGEKAGIQGRALNEDGRLQGAHAKHVRLVVDELAEIVNHEAIKVAMANLRVGTESFKFIGLANPESWENPSCQYCIPPDGISSVNVDTGSWMSTFGCFVRHHDGLKSPCVRDPSLRSKFPFIVNQDEIDATLAEAGGNPDAPQFWKMIRGFPVPSGSSAPVVLDARVATQQRVSEPVPFSEEGIVATVAGIDPAWSEGGDNAYRARAYIRVDPFGRPFLDFTNGLQRLSIYATDPRPPVQQMRDQVIELMRYSHEAPFRYTAVDASANQGLADDLMIYAGADCLGVNNSVKASEEQLRANDPRPVRETIHDRGAEAWCVLAEFCKAGQVRGLPMEALAALTSRRFAQKKGKNGVLVGMAFPLRLEDKAEFKKRFKHSPDACDACALAALAAKERFGLMPFGYLPEAPRAESMFPNTPVGPVITAPPEPSFGTQFDDTEMSWCP